MRRSLLRVTAAGYQRHRAIADFPAWRISTDRDDFTGAFHTDDFRRAWRRRVESLALKQIRAIYAGVAYANQNFIGLDRGLGNFAELERVLIAGFFNDYCFHHLYIIFTGICFQPAPS